MSTNVSQHGHIEIEGVPHAVYRVGEATVLVGPGQQLYPDCTTSGRASPWDCAGQGRKQDPDAPHEWACPTCNGARVVEAPACCVCGAPATRRLAGEGRAGYYCDRCAGQERLSAGMSHAPYTIAPLEPGAGPTWWGFFVPARKGHYVEAWEEGGRVVAEACDASGDAAFPAEYAAGLRARFPGAQVNIRPDDVDETVYRAEITPGEAQGVAPDLPTACRRVIASLSPNNTVITDPAAVKALCAAVAGATDRAVDEARLRGALRALMPLAEDEATHEAYRAEFDAAAALLDDTSGRAAPAPARAGVLPQVALADLLPGKTYIRARDDALGIEEYYGPVEAVQLTCTDLRDPATGEAFGRYDAETGLWQLQHPTDGPAYYTDLVICTVSQATAGDDAMLDLAARLVWRLRAITRLLKGTDAVQTRAATGGDSDAIRRARDIAHGGDPRERAAGPD